jgi:hypothetical protein
MSTEKNPVTVDVQANSAVEVEFDPLALPAPIWLTKFIYFFRTGLGLFILLALILNLLLSGCGARSSEFWTPALSLLNAEQISTMIADHSTFSLTNIPDGWVEKVRAHQEENFYLIDFNSDRLCGNGGCLYVGYLFDEDVQKLSLVLSMRVRSELPRGVPFFEIDSSRDVQPPCLKVHEMKNFKQLFQHTFCFNGTEYVKESTIAKPIPQHAD